LWRIAKNTAVGAADAFANDVTEHPVRAAGELVVGAGAVTLTVLAAPEVAAGAGAAAAAVGIGEVGAEVIGGLAAAGWLSIPYIGIGPKAAKDTVAGWNNTSVDRQILMNPEGCTQAQLATADANIQKNLGPAALDTAMIAGGVFGTTYFGAPTIGTGLARAETGRAPLAPTDTTGNRTGEVIGAEGAGSGVKVSNPAYTQAVDAARVYTNIVAQRFEPGRAQTAGETPAETAARRYYVDVAYNLRTDYGYGLLNNQALEAIARTAGNRQVIDFGAGNGYAASLMKQAGVNVKAIDVAPVGKANNTYWYTSAKGGDPAQFKTWTNVEKGDVAALKDAPKDSVLFLSWPPADQMSSAALRNFGGNTVMVLTESGGSTGTSSFWRTLQNDFTLDKSVTVSPMETVAGKPAFTDGHLEFPFERFDPGRQILYIYQRRTGTQ